MPTTAVDAETLKTWMTDLLQKINQLNDQNTATNATLPFDETARADAIKECRNPEKTKGLRKGINNLLVNIKFFKKETLSSDERFTLIQQYYDQYLELLNSRNTLQVNYPDDYKSLTIVLNALTFHGLAKIILVITQQIKILYASDWLYTNESDISDNQLLEDYKKIIDVLPPLTANNANTQKSSISLRRELTRLVVQDFVPISTDLVRFLIESWNKQIQFTADLDHCLESANYLPASVFNDETSLVLDLGDHHEADQILANSDPQGILGEGLSPLYSLQRLLMHCGYRTEECAATELSRIIRLCLNLGPNGSLKKINGIDIDRFKAKFNETCSDGCGNDTEKAAVANETERYFNLPMVNRNIKRALLGRVYTRAFSDQLRRQPDANKQTLKRKNLCAAEEDTTTKTGIGLTI